MTRTKLVVPSKIKRCCVLNADVRFVPKADIRLHRSSRWATPSEWPIMRRSYSAARLLRIASLSFDVSRRELRPINCQRELVEFAGELEWQHERLE